LGKQLEIALGEETVINLPDLTDNIKVLIKIVSILLIML